jgi:dihydropteroate synthase
MNPAKPADAEASTGPALCYQREVEMVRVHDVAETAALFRVLDAVDTTENP